MRTIRVICAISCCAPTVHSAVPLTISSAARPAIATKTWLTKILRELYELGDGIRQVVHAVFPRGTNVNFSIPSSSLTKLPTNACPIS